MGAHQGEFPFPLKRWSRIEAGRNMAIFKKTLNISDSDKPAWGMYPLRITGVKL